MSKLYLFHNMNNSLNDELNCWINNNEIKNPVILIEPYGHIGKKFSSLYPVYFTRDVIQVSSPIDEDIYEKSFQFRKNISKKLSINIDNVNIAKDFFNGHFSVESLLVLKEASLELLKSYDAVLICLEYDSLYHSAIIEWAYKNKLSSFNKALYWDNSLKNFLYRDSSSSKYIDKKLPTIFDFFYNKIISFIRKRMSFLFVKKIKNFDIIKLIYKKINNLELKKNINIEKKTNVLMTLTTTGPLYRSNFTPVYNKYVEKSKEKPFIIAPSWLKENAIQNGFDVIIIEDIHIKEKRKILIQKTINLLLLFENKVQKILNEKSNDFFIIVLKKYFNEESTYLKLIDSIFIYYKINEIIKSLKPNCIYKDCIGTVYDNVLFAIAQKNKIPIISSVHASFTEKRRSFPVYNTNYVTVIGENQKKPILKHGYKKNQIIAAGQPELDDGINKWNAKKTKGFIKNIYQQYNSKKKSILIATSVFDSKNEITWIKSLCEFASKRNDIQIFVKPHNGWGHYYESIKNYKNTCLSDEKNSLYPFLMIADLVLTDNSHAGKLAIYLKKPLTVVNISNVKFPFHNFDEENIADIALSENELLEKISDFLKGKNIHKKYFQHYNAYIKHHFTKADGKSADRIVDFILSFGS